MRRALVVLAFSLSLPSQEPQPPQQSEAPPPAETPPERNRQQPQQPAEVAAESVFRQDHTIDVAWRNIGPANPVGRITDVEVVRQKKQVRYVGSGGGGLWKTENGGTTWTNVFDRYGTVSIGDVAVAPSNPDIVWVGTGEENARNSVQWGDGVYKSMDAGKTWKHMGLRETFQIGHIAIHPQNPDIVFVAALGRLWGENEERGVYRTRDGGETWDRVFHLDDKTGCIDVRIDPDRPHVLYTCAFERKRDLFCSNDPSNRFGEKAGLYRSDDGGDNWKQLKTGLPDICKWGRSGLAIWEKNPNTLFLIVETERTGWVTGSRQRAGAAPVDANAPPGERGTALMGVGTEGEDGKEDQQGAILSTITERGAAEAAGLKAGDRVVKVDNEVIKTYQHLLELVRDARGGAKVTITYVRGTGDNAETKTTELTWGRLPPGQTGGRGGFGQTQGPSGQLGSQNEGYQDKQGEDGFQTGGWFRSDNRGETWTRINSLTERPFYYSVIAVDPRDDQNLYSVGTTLWGSKDGGKKFAAINRGIHVDFHAFWVDPDDSEHLIAGCDGGLNETWDRGRSWQVFDNFCAAQYYHVNADNSVPYNVYGGLQDNGTWRGPSRTRNREGIVADDWFTFYGGDGFGAATDPLEPWMVFATSQGGAVGLVDIRTGNQARIEKLRPTGAQRVEFNWDSPFFISPHNRLTFYMAGNYAYRAERYAHLDQRDTRPEQGPIRDGMRAKAISKQLSLTERGTATAFAESPRVQGLLYLGTDDGALWVTEDGGGKWEEIHANLPGTNGPRYVSKLFPSYHSDNRVYVALDGHRSDDLRPLAYVSNDRGKTWHYLCDDIPITEPVHCVVEDPRNSNLLFMGTEFGCWVSLDRGNRWFRFGIELPVVAVRDLFIHDRDTDLIAATHGRGIWIADIEPLRQLTAAKAKRPALLFQPETSILWRMGSRGLSGARDYKASNPPYGVTIYLSLDALPREAPVVTVHDVTGAQVAKLTGKVRPGLQRLQWDARAGQRLASPGAYSARMKFGDDTLIEIFELNADPITQDNGTATQAGQEK